MKKINMRKRRNGVWCSMSGGSYNSPEVKDDAASDADNESNDDQDDADSLSRVKKQLSNEAARYRRRLRESERENQRLKAQLAEDGKSSGTSDSTRADFILALAEAGLKKDRIRAATKLIDLDDFDNVDDATEELKAEHSFLFGPDDDNARKTGRTAPAMNNGRNRPNRRIREAIAGAKRDRGLVVKLIIIDPITNYLGERTNSNVDPSVRAVLFPLSELAQELEVAIVLVRHLNKAGEMKAMYRGGGSIAFIGMSRSAYVFEQHPSEPEQVVMASVKTNLVARDDKWAYTYHLESSTKYDAPEVRWGDRIRMNADTLLKGHDARKDAPERERAEKLLNDLLDEEKGLLTVERIEDEMKKAGISWSTAKAAKRELKLVAKRLIHESGEKKGKTKEWVWRRPIAEESNVVHFEPRARDS